MSIFGEALPHEDDTATSLIRREGFPPAGSYDQMPQVYVCPCCRAINPTHDRDHLLRTAKEEKELERRRLLQLDVFEERAKPLSSAAPRPRPTTLHREPEDDQLDQPAVPPPPMTLEELRKVRPGANPTRLIVTVHHGKTINVDPRDPVSVLVRCGAFEGQTAKVPRGKGAICTWEELFEFPYPNEEEPLEVLVIDDSLPASQDHVFGGVVVPPHALRNRARGDEEVLPVCAEGEMHRMYGRVKETPMGSIVVSWYVKQEGQEADEAVDGKKHLEGPVDCGFVVRRVFQYTDNGTVPFSGGVLCVLRDTDDNCSESTLYLPAGEGAMSTSPYYTKDGFNYLPENRGQIMQLITAKKLGHVLVCVPKSDDANEEDEELLVVGAVPLDFETLYHKGSAVLLVESKVKEDVLWGEISLEWRLMPHAEVEKALEEARVAAMSPAEREAMQQGEGPNESLFVTVARGLNLTNRDGEPLAQAQVSVFAGDMEGSTFVASNELEDDGLTHLVTWNQEVRFIEVDGGQTAIDVHVLEDKQTISSGSFQLEDDHGYVVVKMHDPYDDSIQQGEIVVTYKRVRSNEGGAAKTTNGDANGNDDDKVESANRSPNKSNSGSPNRGRTSEKSASPNKNRSPNRERASEKSASPNKNRSPDRERASEKSASPNKNRSPDRERASEKSASPNKNRSPDRERVSEKSASPNKNRSPDRERVSEKSASPNKNGSPDRERVSEKSRSPYKSESPPKDNSPEKRSISCDSEKGNGEKYPTGSEKEYDNNDEDTQKEEIEREEHVSERCDERSNNAAEEEEQEEVDEVVDQDVRNEADHEECPDEADNLTREQDEEHSDVEKEADDYEEAEPADCVPEAADEMNQQSPSEKQNEEKQPKKTNEQPKKKDEQPKKKDQQPKKKDEQPKKKDEQLKKKEEQPKKKEEQPKKKEEQPKKKDEQLKKKDQQPKKKDQQPKKKDEQMKEATQEAREEEERENEPEYDPEVGVMEPERRADEHELSQEELSDDVADEEGAEDSASKQHDEPEDYPQENVAPQQQERDIRQPHWDDDELKQHQKEMEMERAREMELAGRRQQEGEAPAPGVGSERKPQRALIREPDSSDGRGTSTTDGSKGRGSSPAYAPPSRSRSDTTQERSQSDGTRRHHGLSPLGHDTDESYVEKLASRKVPSVRQPWYPTSNATNEDHIPLEKRESFRNRTDSIRELERRSRESSRGSGRYQSHYTSHD